MRVTIIYATNSGSTYLVSKLIEQTVQKSLQKIKRKGKECTVTVVTAQSADADTIANSDLVLLGSPSWNFGKEEGLPHETMRSLMDRLSKEKFQGKDFAVFGCGDRSYTYFCGAVDHLERFIKERGGKLICPSLKIDGFYFAEVENRDRVVTWAGRLI